MKVENKFRASFLSIFDNPLKFSWISILSIITNFTIITKKINEFDLNININLLIIILLLFSFSVIFKIYGEKMKSASYFFNGFKHAKI